MTFHMKVVRILSMSVNSFVIAKYGHLPKIQAERAGVGSLGAEGERGEYMCLDEDPDMPAFNTFCLFRRSLAVFTGWP